MEVLSKSRHTTATALAAIWLAIAPGADASADAESLEYAIKANYLYKLGAYVEWPRTAFASPASPLRLCVAGDDPFGALLDQAVSGQRVNGRPIVVQRMRNVTPSSDCHILYLGYDPQRANQTVAALSGNPVLTVSDVAGTDATISFVITEQRVRFVIDDDAAARNGLVISSKLLNLALSVKPRQAR